MKHDALNVARGETKHNHPMHHSELSVAQLDTQRRGGNKEIMHKVQVICLYHLCSAYRRGRASDFAGKKKQCKRKQTFMLNSRFSKFVQLTVHDGGTFR